MSARRPHLALALAALLAGSAACWSDIKQEDQQGTMDSAATGAPPLETQSGAALPGTAGPTGPVDTSGVPPDTGAAAATGAGRAGQPAGTNAGARDTTAAARPPR